MTQQEITLSKIAFKKAFEDFNLGLNAYAYFKVHDKSVGDGLVQDTFVKAWKYILKGEKVIVIKSLLYHILKHLIIDEYRKNKNQSLDLLSEKGFEPSIIETDKWIIEIDGKNAQRMILKLPFSYIKIMSMRYVQDLTIPEISVLTKKSKNNIAVILFRGLKKLKIINFKMICKGEKTSLKTKNKVVYFR